MQDPTQTLVGRAVFDAQGQVVGQVAELRLLRSGDPSVVMILLRDGRRVSVRATQLAFLSANNALVTRLSRAQIERLRRAPSR